MQNEMFTFVVCTHIGHAVDYVYCTRREADKHFDELVRQMHEQPHSEYVAYYCGSVGGLVNSARKS